MILIRRSWKSKKRVARSDEDLSESIQSGGPAKRAKTSHGMSFTMAMTVSHSTDHYAEGSGPGPLPATPPVAEDQLRPLPYNPQTLRVYYQPINFYEENRTTAYYLHVVIWFRGITKKYLDWYRRRGPGSRTIVANEEENFDAVDMLQSLFAEANKMVAGLNKNPDTGDRAFAEVLISAAGVAHCVREYGAAWALAATQAKFGRDHARDVLCDQEQQGRYELSLRRAEEETEQAGNELRDLEAATYMFNANDPSQQKI